MEQQKPRAKQRAVVFVAGGMGSGKDKFIDRLEDSGRLGPEGSYVVIGPKTVQDMITTHEAELSRASPISLDREIFNMLRRVKEGYAEGVLHPEKLPENITAYNQVIHAAALEAIHNNKSVVVNTHGDNVPLIEDIVMAASRNSYNAHILMVQMTMRPQDVYQMGEDRIEQGKLREEDLPRMLDSHKASREMVRRASHYAALTVVFNRKHDPDPEKRGPQPAVIYEPSANHGLVSTIISPENYRDFTLWQHALTQAKTFDEFKDSLREPELRSSTHATTFRTPYIPSPAQRELREFAEELFDISLGQGRSR